MAAQNEVHLPIGAPIETPGHCIGFVRIRRFRSRVTENYNELELQQLLNQFFERATCYSVAAYEEARERTAVSVAREARGLTGDSVSLATSRDGHR
jgi:hypothetical protein